MINPYRIGSWVVGPDFYNRDDSLEDILQGSANGLWFIGNRRIGKTSLLRMAEYKAANTPEYLPLFWDMQGNTKEKELIQSLLEALEYAQGSDLDARWQDITLPEGASSISQALRHVATHARQHHCRLLLLCDEIEGLNKLGKKSPHVLSALRRVLQHNPRIRTILTSTRRLSRLYAIQQQEDTSMFLEGFEPRYLANFSDAVANQLICCLKSERPLIVDEAILAEIRFFSGNHPLILQKIGSQLFDAEKGELHSFDKSAFVLDVQLESTFQQDFDALTPDEARILSQVSRDNLILTSIFSSFSDISKHSLRRILHTLTQLGYLRRIDNTYQAGNILLKQWLATNPTHHPKRGGVTNWMQREVAEERIKSLQRQLITAVRYLGILKVQQLKEGAAARPHIIMEIEDYEKKIANLEAELVDLGETV